MFLWFFKSSVEMSHVHSNLEASNLQKHNQACIVLIPVSITCLVLYSFYLRCQRRLRPRSTFLECRSDMSNRVELGLRKDMAEVQTVVRGKERFSARDAQCSVCLGNYQANDRLRQIHKCGHMFHDGCIGRWLTTHTTCPLCRLSLQAPRRTPVNDCYVHVWELL